MAIIDNASIKNKIVEAKPIREKIDENMKSLTAAKEYGRIISIEMKTVQNKLSIINNSIKYSNVYQKQLKETDSSAMRKTYSDFLNSIVQKRTLDEIKEKVKDGYYYIIKVREMVFGDGGSIKYQILDSNGNVYTLDTKGYLDTAFGNIGIDYRATTKDVIELSKNIIEINADVEEMAKISLSGYDKKLFKNDKKYNIPNMYKNSESMQSVLSKIPSNHNTMIYSLFRTTHNMRATSANYSPIWRYLTEIKSIPRSRSFEIMSYMSSRYNIKTRDDVINIINSDAVSKNFFDDLDTMMSSSRTKDTDSFYSNPDSFAYVKDKLVAIENKTSSASVKINTVINGVNKLNKIFNNINLTPDSLTKELQDFFFKNFTSDGAAGDRMINEYKKQLVEELKLKP